VIDGAVLTAEEVLLVQSAGTLRAVLSNNSVGIAGQTIVFTLDANGDSTPESLTAVTNAQGVAEITIQASLPSGLYPYTASWDGKVMSLNDQAHFALCLLTTDLTGDCHITLDDFSILASQWLQSGNPAACALTADLANDDCVVNSDDLMALIADWLK